MFDQRGQNMIEYLLVFTAVVMILVVALGRSGFMTKSINGTLDQAVEGVRCMAYETCYDPAGCPPAPGNGCCEPGETGGVDCGCGSVTCPALQHCEFGVCVCDTADTDGTCI